MLQIYCGGGKGKTTAAIGLAVRGVGAGMRVRFVQFMKGAYTSELSVLGNISGLEMRRCDRDYGFFKNMSGQDKLDITRCHNDLLAFAFSPKVAGNKTADDNAPDDMAPESEMIILDEFCGAYAHGLMDKALAERLILENKDRAEVILTGRDPAEIFTDAADYISEIRCLRHPYERGVSARKGVEF